MPSTLIWSRTGRRCSFRQTTAYPYESHIRVDATASSPEKFSVFFRIPQWADGARLSINGMSDWRTLHPGAFAEISREWKTGDWVELELPLKMRLEAVDRGHPDAVALLAGPLVLMPVTRQAPGQLRRATLLSARRNAGTARAWTAGSDDASLTLRAFMDIQDEPTRPICTSNPVEAEKTS
ncbi:MAG: hypothetical protein ACJ74Z_13460 [Bryobacteraceae bacterium]